MTFTNGGGLALALFLFAAFTVIRILRSPRWADIDLDDLDDLADPDPTPATQAEVTTPDAVHARDEGEL